jgi:hypothetical protein
LYPIKVDGVNKANKNKPENWQKVRMRALAF